MSFLVLAFFEVSSLRTQFQPFTDVPSENFAPRYKENGCAVTFSGPPSSQELRPAGHGSAYAKGYSATRCADFTDGGDKIADNEGSEVLPVEY